MDYPIDSRHERQRSSSSSLNLSPANDTTVSEWLVDGLRDAGSDQVELQRKPDLLEDALDWGHLKDRRTRAGYRMGLAGARVESWLMSVVVAKMKSSSSSSNYWHHWKLNDTARLVGERVCPTLISDARGRQAHDSED